MKDIIAVIIAASALMGLIFGIAIVGGTIVWMVWPVVNHVFPQLVASGYLASSLSWWDSVCLTWLLALLIKSSHTSKKE